MKIISKISYSSFVPRIRSWIVLCLPLLFCHKQLELNENIIFIVEDKPFSLEEFRQRYELDPAFPGYNKGYSGIKEYAEKLIDHFLADRLGQKEGLYEIPPFSSYLNYERQRAVIQSYYKEVVKNKINVNDQEIRDAFLKSEVKLHVKHLFSPDSFDAQKLYKSLQQGTSFDELAKNVFAKTDSSLGGPDLGVISWGELDPALEKEVYCLNISEYSKPIKSRWGYHILFVIDRKENKRFTQSDYQEKYYYIHKKLKRRKEEIASGKYLKDFLDPLKITVKKEAFIMIVQTLKIGYDNQTKLVFQPIQPITDEQISLIENYPEYDPEQLFLTSTYENWTLKEFLSKLKKLPVTERPQVLSPEKLKEDIGIFIRNEFIYEDAVRKKILKSAEVDSVVQEARQKLAYAHYLKNIYKSYEIPEEIKLYYQNKYDKNTKTNAVPTAILHGMNTPESYRWYYSSRKLHNHLLSMFPEIRIQINEKRLNLEAKKINWEKPIRMYTLPLN